jgi:prepilin-type N-terminal cleavage/methylation domain-containing protein
VFELPDQISERVRRGFTLIELLVVIAILAAMERPAIASSSPQDLASLVGKPVDIAPSAYQYRADRMAEDNPPESWLALMWYARQALNKPVDVNAPAIKQVLCGLLWEEIRPVKQIELTWSTATKRRPAPGDLVITTLESKGSSSSWWNNLDSVTKSIKATLSNNGSTYLYDLPAETCGIVISVAGASNASEYDMPAVKVLVADLWKKMDLEIEWGFEPTTWDKDYSGRVEAYDGKLSEVRPLDGDVITTTTGSGSWRPVGKGSARRGFKASLLYMGTAKWRRVQPFTSQRDDVARTIVTLWTKAGNFSFLAADLENGPILVPEHGVFIRRTTPLLPPPVEPAPDLRVPRMLLTNKMSSIAGSAELLGWGSDSTPWFGGNPADKPVSVLGITIPARNLAMHPGPTQNVAVGWSSPIQGMVKIKASVAHGQSGGNGIEWWIARETNSHREHLAHGTTDGSGAQAIPAEAEAKNLDEITVELGDMISLVVGPKGAHQCDTTVIELVINEVGGSERVWNFTQDVISTLLTGNPHADGQGQADVWNFYAERSTSYPPVIPSQPPLVLASQAASAREFITELQVRKLSTIRQQTRGHEEQTWEGAVTAMRGTNLPAHPAPPKEYVPPMEVQVPSERLTAQWNLGVWHLLRHCEKNPKNGRLWFNDYPYGILGAETYMVLAALDLMGSHEDAADGFDQWLSLSMDPNSTGHHEWALLDRPNGLFTDGHGCLTHAVGSPGLGGHMDGVHAFGPGSIGWALTQHYWLTGDIEWLRTAAPRIKANAEWMLRQRRVLSSLVPGGDRLWCKGLQPALQVTPDSGGLWMQFYECEAYYWASVSRFATALSVIDPDGGAKLRAEAEAYGRDLRAAVDRSIALSPVVPVRDGTFRSVIPFACYVRGLGTGAWGWGRDGSGEHVGPLYWETVQTAAALISPAGLLSPNDPRVQGYLDVLEDRLLLENARVGQRDWFQAGWQYQAGLERTANMHLAGDDIPCFLRSLLNGYAIDILPNEGYVFNEHATRGPPDKIFEEAAFLERFRGLLVCEEGPNLWLARATPRAWLAQGRKISVKNAPTYFGTVGFEITSDVDQGRIMARLKMPSRDTARQVWLRLRHPNAAPIRGVKVNGRSYLDFDPGREIVKLHDLTGTVSVEVRY